MRGDIRDRSGHTNRARSVGAVFLAAATTLGQVASKSMETTVSQVCMITRRTTARI